MSSPATRNGNLAAMVRLPPLDPAVAQARLAARVTLREIRANRIVRNQNVVASMRQSHLDLDPQPLTGQGGRQRDPLCLVALSGGADSLALAAAVAFEAPRAVLRAGAVIIDHGLQTDSHVVAETAAQQAVSLGLSPVIIRRVQVEECSGDGPEAAAREARYAAIESVRAEHDAIAVLTAHTRDDQVEQVFLALVRGSGTRSIAAIPPQRGKIYRPFLGLSRRETEAVCAAAGLQPWRDPHNTDDAYLRVRVRQHVVPFLTAQLGESISANLARSAELARIDADALDALASKVVAAHLQLRQDHPAEIAVSVLAAEQPAIATRVIREIAAQIFDSSLSHTHTETVFKLVTNWRGQGPIHVPQGQIQRVAGRLTFTPAH